jgi:hypothetical protein
MAAMFALRLSLDIESISVNPSELPALYSWLKPPKALIVLLFTASFLELLPPGRPCTIQKVAFLGHLPLYCISVTLSGVMEPCRRANEKKNQWPFYTGPDTHAGQA